LRMQAACCLIMPMPRWRGDDVGASGVLGGAASAIIGIAAVVVAVIALANAQRDEALLAIGIAAVVVSVVAMATLLMRKRIGNWKAKRYLTEERGIIADLRAALEEVKKDLEAPSEHRDLPADHIADVRVLVARIKHINGIDYFADRAAEDILHGTFRADKPDASLDTVIIALIDCEKAEYSYNGIEEQLKSGNGWLQHMPKPWRH
jgi:hypothetical protein